MRRRYVIVLTGIVLSLALFTGCGSRRTAEREAELQEEISELRQEIDDLRAGQDSQNAGAQIFGDAVIVPALAGVAFDKNLSAALRHFNRTTERTIYTNGFHNSNLTATGALSPVVSTVIFSISPGASTSRLPLYNVLPSLSATMRQER